MLKHWCTATDFASFRLAERHHACSVIRQGICLHTWDERAKPGFWLGLLWLTEFNFAHHSQASTQNMHTHRHVRVSNTVISFAFWLRGRVCRAGVSRCSAQLKFQCECREDQFAIIRQGQRRQCIFTHKTALHWPRLCTLVTCVDRKKDKGKSDWQNTPKTEHERRKVRFVHWELWRNQIAWHKHWSTCQDLVTTKPITSDAFAKLVENSQSGLTGRCSAETRWP